jgi:methylglyoxal synthase
MDKVKNIAMIAHDHRKQDLIEWVEWNWEILQDHNLVCTGTTGRMVEEALRQNMKPGSAKKLNINILKSGPLGGDQQMGAYIAEGKIDIIIFLWDPMSAQPHDVDVKALLRIAVLYNIPTACNRSTADFMISSELFSEPYTRDVKNYQEYIDRSIGDS